MRNRSVFFLIGQRVNRLFTSQTKISFFHGIYWHNLFKLTLTLFTMTQQMRMTTVFHMNVHELLLNQGESKIQMEEWSRCAPDSELKIWPPWITFSRTVTHAFVIFRCAYNTLSSQNSPDVQLYAKSEQFPTKLIKTGKKGTRKRVDYSSPHKQRCSILIGCVWGILFSWRVVLFCFGLFKTKIKALQNNNILNKGSISDYVILL